MQYERFEESQTQEQPIQQLVEDTVMVLISCLPTTRDVAAFGITSKGNYAKISAFYKTPYGQGLKLAESLEKMNSEFLKDFLGLDRDNSDSGLSAILTTNDPTSISANLRGINLLWETIKNINLREMNLKQIFYRTVYRSTCGVVLLGDLYRSVTEQNRVTYNTSMSWLRKQCQFEEDVKQEKFLLKYPFFAELRRMHIQEGKRHFVEVTINTEDIPQDLQNTTLMLKEVLAATSGSKMTLFKPQLEAAMKTVNHSQQIINSYLR